MRGISGHASQFWGNLPRLLYRLKVAMWRRLAMVGGGDVFCWNWAFFAWSYAKRGGHPFLSRFARHPAAAGLTGRWHGKCTCCAFGRSDSMLNGLRRESGMLLLKRKETEQIVIGGDVVITVKEIRGNRVQLAISAPQGVRILRGELHPIDDASPVPRNAN